MQRFKEFVKNAVGFLLFIVFFFSLFMWALDDTNKPIAYRSASTGEIVRAELHGKSISVNDIGKSYYVIWVK